MKAELKGMDELMREIENIGRDMKEHKEEALIQAGKFFQEEVKKNTPIDTGNLRNHIELSDVKDGSIDVFVDQQGKAYYGVMVEEGSSKMKAQPYMYPTYVKSRNKIQSKLVDVLRLRLML